MGKQLSLNQDTYIKNLDALQLKYSHITKLVKANSNPLITLLPGSSNNNYRLIFASEETPYRVFFNHAKYNNRIRDINPFETLYCNIIFIGIHSFLHLKKQYKIPDFDKFRIVIFEPNIDVFQIVLHLHDLTLEFQRDDIIFIVGNNNYFSGIQSLNFERIYKKDMLYKTYNYCKDFLNYDWTLKFFSTDIEKNVFKNLYKSFRKYLWKKIYSGRYDYKILTDVQDKCSEFYKMLMPKLFEELKNNKLLAKSFKKDRPATESKYKILLVSKPPRLWNWIRFFQKGFLQNNFDVKVIEIDKQGNYVKTVLHEISSYRPDIFVTINRYAFLDKFNSVAIEDALRRFHIPYISFVLDHLDYFFWESELRELKYNHKYKLITYDRFFMDNYNINGTEPLTLIPMFSLYPIKPKKEKFIYDICISNRLRQSHMHLFPEQEIIYRKLTSEPSAETKISSRLYILLWKLVNKLDEYHKPNFNRQVILGGVRCFKMGFDAFIRRDIVRTLCDNFKNVAVFGNKEWEMFIPKRNYNGYVKFDEMLEIYSTSKIVVDSFISWSDTAVHDFISLSHGGFTLYLSPAISYENPATSCFEYYSNIEELIKKVSYYLNNEDLRHKKLQEIQSAITKYFSSEKYFKRASEVCKEIIINNSNGIERDPDNDNKEFGFYVNKCDKVVFSENIDQFFANLMASIIYFYSGYLFKARECFSLAKKLHQTDSLFDGFELKLKTSNYYF